MKRVYRLPDVMRVLAVMLISLTLPSSCKEDTVLIDPVLNSIQAADADITSSTADLKGEITILGNRKIVEYGIQISASMIFTNYTDKKVLTTPVAGQFTVNFTGLIPNTIYYYRAYAIVNTAHIYAPDPLHFTTKN